MVFYDATRAFLPGANRRRFPIPPKILFRVAGRTRPAAAVTSVLGGHHRPVGYQGTYTNFCGPLAVMTARASPWHAVGLLQEGRIRLQQTWRHSGFSVRTSVTIPAVDRDLDAPVSSPALNLTENELPCPHFWVIFQVPFVLHGSLLLVSVYVPEACHFVPRLQKVPLKLTT